MTTKLQLHQHCLQLAQEQVDRLLTIQAELKDALGSESKSTAGDKHETGRAMIQLEQERAGEQLRQAEQQLSSLLIINPKQSSQMVQTGSLVLTNTGVFYISVGLGKVLLDDKTYFVVSPNAPVAMALLGKKAGEETVVNGQAITIDSIL